MSTQPDAPRSPSLRPSRRPVDSPNASEFEALLRTAREKKASAPHQAVGAVLQALELAERASSTQIERRVADNTGLFEEILKASLGAPDSILELANELTGHASLSPTRAYLLSRIDGSTTSGEICSLSPLSPMETLRHLAELVRSGMIRVR